MAMHLMTQLFREGYRVRATFRRGPPPVINGDIEWVQVPDIGPDTSWSESLKDIDVVFHLAGLAHQLDASQASLAAEYIRVNAHGTRQLVRSFASDNRRGRVVLLGSIGAVRTTSNEVIGPETPENPDTHYGRSKLLAEQMLSAECADTFVDWCVLRAPLVYGPGAPGNIQRLIRLVRRGWPLPLGLATAKRSMVFVGNLVDALIACGQDSNASGRIFLVADNEYASVAELVELIAELSSTRVRLINVPRLVMMSAARFADVLAGNRRDRGSSFSKAVDLLFGGLSIDANQIRTALNWRPPYSLREGLAMTIRADGHFGEESSRARAGKHV